VGRSQPIRRRHRPEPASSVARVLLLACALLAVACAGHDAGPPDGVTTRPGTLVHQINVGWGGSVLVRGPDGTTILLEAGNTGYGTSTVVPYLTAHGIPPAAGLDYTIAGHHHCDHIGGMDEVVRAGYDVRERNYDNGSSYSTSCVSEWSARRRSHQRRRARRTRAGRAHPSAASMRQSSDRDRCPRAEPGGT
jgi:beta-lactamase superfamily II metal-dependent hydrolase